MGRRKGGGRSRLVQLTPGIQNPGDGDSGVADGGWEVPSCIPMVHTFVTFGAWLLGPSCSYTATHHFSI